MVTSTTSIPIEMQSLRQWVVWRLESRGEGKTTKMPYQPDGRPAKVDDPNTWVSWDEAIAATVVYDFSGVGFVFTEDDPYCGIDVDGVIDESGVMIKEALALVARAGTYTEFSPSRRGLHMIAKAKLPGEGKRRKVWDGKATLEIYDRGRYFTMTGHAVDDTSPSPVDRQDWCVQVWRKLHETAKQSRCSGSSSPWAHLSDDGIIKELCKAPKYKKLWEGNTDEYDSASEADAAFFSRLVDLCGDDKARVLRLAGLSGLRRGKWREHPDYLERTYKLALRKDRSRVLNAGNPLFSARVLVASRYSAGSVRLLHRYDEDFYSWEGVCYQMRSDSAIRAAIWLWLDTMLRWDAKAKAEVPFQPNTTKVNDVFNGLAALTIYEGESPGWVGDEVVPPRDLIALSNGLFQLSTGKLLPHTPAFFSTHACEFLYDASATCPKWTSFLSEVWEDDTESIALLQEWFGYMLSGDTKHQKIWLLVGPPRSGKGTITRVLTELVGRPFTVQPTFASLGERFGLQPLIGKRCAFITDARLSSRTDASRVLERLISISGEDDQTVDRKNKTAWIGRLGARFCVVTNELPRMIDASGALAQRWSVLQTSRNFEKGPHAKTLDPDLTEKLCRELPGIFNWAVDGYKRLQDRREFSRPKSTEASVTTLADLSSPVAAFIRDRCEVGRGLSASCKTVYQAYVTWCAEQGARPLSAAYFGRDLFAAEPDVKRARAGGGARQWQYAGLELADNKHTEVRY